MARTDTLGHFLTDVADAIRTKNGSSDTIKASDFDDAISNITTGLPIPATVSELNTDIIGTAQAFVDYLETLPSSYPTYTNDPVTLYTPNTEFQYYAIQKRASGKYRVFWSRINLLIFYDSGIRYPLWKIKSSTQSNINITDIFSANTVWLDHDNNASFYYSPEYDTVEECIQKMRNNELSYTLANTFLAAAEDTPYIVPYTNLPVIKITSVENNQSEIKPSQRISQSETIQLRQ